MVQQGGAGTQLQMRARVWHVGACGGAAAAAHTAGALSFCRHPLSVPIETPTEVRGGCSRTPQHLRVLDSKRVVPAVVRRELVLPPAACEGAAEVERMGGGAVGHSGTVILPTPPLGSY